MDRIKVAIIEDDLDWMKFLTDFLNACEDITIVGNAVNRQAGIKAVEAAKPDIVLINIDLDGNRKDGIYTSLEISESTTAKIIMMTLFKDEDIILESFTAGAVNCVIKDEYMEIPQIIRFAYKNEALINIVLKDYLRLKEEELLRSFTPAEREVFELIKLGYKRSQIEEKLYKSSNTIKAQVKRIIEKLGVKNSKEAVKKIRMKGIS